MLIRTLVLLIAAMGPARAEGETKLAVGDGAPADQFGHSVAVCGDVAVVGAFGDDIGPNIEQGSTYVFRWSGSAWMEETKLVASDGAGIDWFGYSAAVWDDVIVVGATFDDVGVNNNQGSAYVFRWDGATWQQEQQLTAEDGSAGDEFGNSVAVYRDIIVVGRQYDLGGGSTSVFRWNGTIWVEEQELTASDKAPGDGFGHSVSLSNDRLIVGANLDKVGAHQGQGSAYVFSWDGAQWIEVGKLTANDGEVEDRFGESVAMLGEVAVVGAYQHDIGTSLNQGAAYIFRWDGTSWQQEQKLTASDGAINETFGNSVALSGDVVVVSAVDDDVGSSVNQGSAYVFRWDGMSWVEEKKLTPSDGAVLDSFGKSVAVSGAVAVVGSPNSNNDLGSLYVYDLLAPAWTWLGGASAGSADFPHLAGSGVLSTGSSNQLDLASAKSSSPATLVVGNSQINAPFKGGVMIPIPQLLVFLPTSSAGTVHLAFVMPAVPGGATLCFQFWIQDPAAIGGYAASNGLKGVTS